MDPSKRRFLWETILFRFHVSFQGCTRHHSLGSCCFPPNRPLLEDSQKEHQQNPWKAPPNFWFPTRKNTFWHRFRNPETNTLSSNTKPLIIFNPQKAKHPPNDNQRLFPGVKGTGGFATLYLAHGLFTSDFGYFWKRWIASFIADDACDFTWVCTGELDLGWWTGVSVGWDSMRFGMEIQRFHQPYEHIYWQLLIDKLTSIVLCKMSLWVTLILQEYGIFSYKTG